ncbi:MAG: peptide chain release factor N(5)-glutamine methyltransferase [Candidatus Binatia bacterium]
MENQTIESTEISPRLVSAVLRQAAQRLISCGIESGALDAEILLGHVLGMGREQIVVAANTPLNDTDGRAYEGLLSRRLRREPTSYITGRREFWSLDLHVTRDVLIPRPETELLVEIALTLAKGSARARRIIDLGTGSGAIAVALASELTNAEIVATDVSAEALAVAAGNAVLNGVNGRIRFALGDLFEPIQPEQPVDLIVSNPPYIRRSDIDTLEPEVSRWEPRGALDGGLDGLEYYRRIAAHAFRYLAPDGALAVEIGASTGQAVAALFQDTPACAAVSIYNDYTGMERVVVARKAAARITSI